MDKGSQVPRFSYAAAQVANAADEAVELCDLVGMPLDEWQQTALQLMLGVREDGLWSAFEFGLVVPRQNGKGGVLEARELAGLFLFGERLIIHSAHEEGTANEAFMRMRNLIDGSEFLSRRVAKMTGAPGKQRIMLKNGARLQYKTRTAGGGRGYSGAPIILDEAQHLTAAQLAAILPVASAQPNPQVIYAGTVRSGATAFRGVVDRGRTRTGDRFAYAEWSAPDDAVSSDRSAWAIANPAIGTRISWEYVQAEHDAFVAAGAEQEFREERLSIWPESDLIGQLISTPVWAAGGMPQMVMPRDGQISIGVAVSPDREWSAVAVAWRVGGLIHVDLARLDKDTDWLIPHLADVCARRDVISVAVDQGGPAGTLLVAMGAAKLPVRVVDTAGFKTACAGFVDAVRQSLIRHREQPELTESATGVRERRVGDGYVYSRRDSAALTAPVEAVALAVWGLTPDPKRKEFFMMNLADFA